MMLLSFLYDIDSELRSAEKIDINLAYRRNLGYDKDEVTPDHST